MRHDVISTIISSLHRAKHKTLPSYLKKISSHIYIFRKFFKTKYFNDNVFQIIASHMGTKETIDNIVDIKNQMEKYNTLIRVTSK